MGRRLPCTLRHSLAGAHSARNRVQEVVRGPRLAAHVRGHRRRAKRRRAEDPDRSRHVPGYRPDDARRFRPAQLPRRHVGRIGARLLLLLLGCDAFGGPLPELEDVLYDVATWTGRMAYASDA